MPPQTSSSHCSDDHESSDPSTPPRAAAAAAAAATTTSRGSDATISPPAAAAKNGLNDVGAQTPKSAPTPAAGVRPRSASKKMEHTLLADFLLGRQTPARLAADRKRRESIDAVKAELRQQMREASVRKLQQPGGVRDRVQNWQKANAAAIARGCPEDAASEPTDVAFDDEELASVTEEDRVRIKMRQKIRKRASTRTRPMVQKIEGGQAKASATTNDDASTAPKKRVVSDENWMRPRIRKSSMRKVSPRLRKPSNQTAIPSGFVFRSQPNPSASSKVKAWAAQVQAPSELRRPRSSRSIKVRERCSQYEDSQSDRLSDMGDTASQVTARQSIKSRPNDDDDRIRVKPIRKRNNDNDGIRVKAMDSPSGTSQDDGIRVRPMSAVGSESSAPRPASIIVRYKSKTTSSSPRNGSSLKPSKVEKEASELSQATQTTETTEATEELDDSLLDTPTKGPKSKSHPAPKSRPPKSHHTETMLSSEIDSWLSERQSNMSSEKKTTSELASSIACKSIADIPGDIPFGHSAFSELDLPLNGGAPKSRPKRTKTEKNSSLKGMPSVFKKVMEEGKKIIQDINEPPRHPAANNPPSIEKWLNNTVDPFVESSTATDITSPPKEKQPPREKEKPAPKSPSEEAKPRRKASHSHEAKSSAPSTPRLDTLAQTDEVKPRRKSSHSHDAKSSAPSTPNPQSGGGIEEITEAISESTNTTPRAHHSTKKNKSPPSAGLRRSRATRNSFSPLKPGNKIPFLGVLKEAFQGESSGPSQPRRTYESHEERKIIMTDDFPSEYWSSSSELSGLTGLSDATSSRLDSDLSDLRDHTRPQMAGPRLPPPTNGQYELSTILSEEGSSVVESDLTSDMTKSTLTQSTTATKESDASSRLPHNHAPGLKRRLTRHSDLVSVLSLPDDSNIPRGIRNNRSRPSLRKRRGTTEDATTEDLLKEFADDENLYQRELKTLVDGVVPVLLTHVVHEKRATDFLGPVSPQMAETLSRSVINMGIALEKLKHAHRKAPTTDIRRLAHWAHGVVPIYHSYLGAWRLGFQDVVVNLAPRGNGLGDEDSLLNALPRNEHGDIVNAQGERVAVAHLLKRPLIRVKQMTSLVKCVDSIIGSTDTQDLLRDFEELQEKARRRHREESARMTDEEAINTDTTRARDLRTLAAAKAVFIEPSRQVSAKDIFSLHLVHSNGQRLECQVELIHRDNQSHPEDTGDLLIREAGSGPRSYLLFPPVSMSLISARTGDGNFDMVVMVRGTYRNNPWHELLTLTADDEDQILDWLDILPISPIPAREPEPSIIGGDDEPSTPNKFANAPIGVQHIPRDTHRTSTAESSSPVTPSTPVEHRPLPSRYRPRQSAGDSRPLREDMRPDAEALRREAKPVPPQPEDPPPRPPVHRTLSPSPQKSEKTPSSVKPSVELSASDKIKRRTSSPLKHEYLPSDVSSTSDTESLYETDVVSSDDEDEIESLYIPETEIGVSIKRDLPPIVESLITASECSLTPSNSASQAGLHGPKTAPQEPATRNLASISRWSEKGKWKDITENACSIVVTAGLIEAYPIRVGPQGDEGTSNEKPLIALDLTPLVLIRQSTAVDLEIRSSVQPHCQLSPVHGGGNFRFRCLSAPDCYELYMSVHHARLHNQKFIQLENESRFNSFGERGPPEDNDGESSSRRRRWFGRKNSYRGSVRAPSQSQDGHSTTPSSTPSASSFLKRLTIAGNLSFNIADSSVNKTRRVVSGGNSLYTTESSSASATPPRSPSASLENSARNLVDFNSENIRIRLHLLVSATRWEDFGNCSLQIRRPPPGWHQALRADHGLEKRVTVTTVPRKDSDKPVIVLDAVLGSGCFTTMGNRGIVCGVWEEMKDGSGAVGMAPATGATGGNIKKWCFQLGSAGEAGWVLRLLHQEVIRA